MAYNFEEERKKVEALWIPQKCPLCGHVADPVFMIDLVDGPVERTCQSVFDPGTFDCNYKWSVEMDKNMEETFMKIFWIIDEYDSGGYEVVCSMNLFVKKRLEIQNAK